MKSMLFWSLIMISFSSFSQDREITFSYWSEAGPPFVFLDDKNLKDVSVGLVKDLADLISGRLKASPRFVNIPVKRTESQLISGGIDLNCITSPIWKETPDEYNWSPALFQGADRLLVKSLNAHDIAALSDLKGKLLGIYNGYTYHPEIMKMIEEGYITPVKVSGVDHGIQLLLLDRIDALIDFDIILDYKIKNEYPEALALADLYVERYDLFCAYSKKSPFGKAQLDKVFDDIISQDEITKLLNRYKL
jgi:ABC-type amino acid transport substrate-binding protein